MAILRDERKNRRLTAARNLSFDNVVPIILEKRYLAVLENPVRPDRMIFLVRYRGYTQVVPFEVDSAGNMPLKTIFPSRKFHKLYGVRKGEKQA